jgi:hypothetical protein
MLLAYVSAEGLKNDEVVSLENFLVLSSPSNLSDDMVYAVQAILEALEWKSIKIKIEVKD